MQRISGGLSSTAGPDHGDAPPPGATKGRADRLPSPGRPFTGLAVASALVVLGCLLVFTGTVGSPGAGAAVANVVTPLAAGAATLCCGLAARRGVGRVRLSWGLLCACSACWSVAEASWVVRHPLPEVLPVGVDDLFFLAAIPLGLAAVVLFPARQWQGSDRLRAVLDGLIICGSVVFVVRGLGVLTPGEGRWSVQLVALAYPLGDLVTLTVALLVLLRATRSSAASLGLLVLAFVAICVGDTTYALWIRAGFYTPGTPLDISWVLTYLLLALAALAPWGQPDPVPEGPASYRGHTIPWLLVGASLVAVVVVAATSPTAFAGDWVMTTSCVLVVGLFCVRQAWLFRDQARLNQRLQSESERRAQITGALLDGVLVLDRQGLVSFANPAAAALLGADPDELVGAPAVDMLRADSHDSPDPAQPCVVMQAMRGDGVLNHAAAIFARADGREIAVELSVGPLDRRQHQGVVVVFRDVTARRAVEQMKDEFMSVISHELRTPLTSIRGAMALLDAGHAGPLEPAGARMVSIALRSTERISRLVNDILDVERLESGRLHLDLAEHDARVLLETAVHEMSGLATEAGVQLTVGRADGVVRADDDRVVQTLTNLIGNAVKFSPRGTTVTITSCRVVDRVEIAVADHGRGIPADKLEAIFERFEQVDSSDSRQAGGTGLGLSICREIVSLHGGELWVTSTPGEGSEFRFTLPAAPAREPVVEKAPATPVRAGTAAAAEHLDRV